MDIYPENLDFVNKNFKPQVYINFLENIFPKGIQIEWP